MTPEQADQILFTLTAALPHGDGGLDPAQAKARDEVYRKILLGWSFGVTREAVQTVLLATRFYPNLAELHAAYQAAARSRPERVRAALPPADGTVASPAAVRAACEAAVELVAAAVVPPSPRARRPAREVQNMAPFVTPASAAPAAPSDEERAMIEETVARVERAKKQEAVS